MTTKAKSDRVWVSVPMQHDMRARIRKAALHNGTSMSEYMREAIMYYMSARNEWSIRGPQKGS